MSPLFLAKRLIGNRNGNGGARNGRYTETDNARERLPICAGPAKWMCTVGYGHLCQDEGP